MSTLGIIIGIWLLILIILISLLGVIIIKGHILSKRWDKENPDKVKRVKDIKYILENTESYKNIEEEYFNIRDKIDELNKEKEYLEGDNIRDLNYKINRLKRKYLKIRALYYQKINYQKELLRIHNEKVLYIRSKGKKN